MHAGRKRVVEQPVCAEVMEEWAEVDEKRAKKLKTPSQHKGGRGMAGASPWGSAASSHARGLCGARPMACTDVSAGS